MVRSKSEWLFLFNQQTMSGLSAKEFCSLNGISASNFYNAKHRYLSRQKGQEDLFIPVVVQKEDDSEPKQNIELICNGIHLVLPSDCSDQVLTRVIGACANR